MTHRIPSPLQVATCWAESPFYSCTAVWNAVVSEKDAQSPMPCQDLLMTCSFDKPEMYIGGRNGCLVLGYTHIHTHIYIYIHTHNIHIKAGPPTEQVGFYTPQLTRVTIPLYLSDVHQHFATSRSPQGQPQRLTGTWGEVCSWAATWLASSEPMRASMKHLGFKGSKLGEVTGQIWTVRKKRFRIQAAN